MISKKILLDALGLFKNESDNTYVLKNSYETVTEDEVSSLFTGVFYYTGTNGTATPVEYTFEIGMTWEEFIDSDYNTDNFFVINGPTVSISNNAAVFYKVNPRVGGELITSQVIDGGEYYITNEK